MPALLTSTSIREKRSRASSTRRSTASGLRDVGLGGRDGGRVGRDAHELSPSAVEGGGIARAHEHPGAGGKVRARDLEAEAVAAPGDDRRSPREDLSHPVRLPTRT